MLGADVGLMFHSTGLPAGQGLCRARQSLRGPAYLVLRPPQRTLDDAAYTRREILRGVNGMLLVMRFSALANAVGQRDCPLTK